MRMSKEEMCINSLRAENHRKYMERYIANTTMSIQNTRRYDKPIDIIVKGNQDTKTKVEAIGSVEAARKYAEGRTCILNFASYKKPGGAFLEGKLTQEESLCHNSNLFEIIRTFTSTFYGPHMRTLRKGMYTDDLLYSPDVVFLDGESVKLCDVITCAAPNCSPGLRYGNVDSGTMLTALYDRIKYVLWVANKESVDTLILGAYGCGVFKNNPHVVATSFNLLLGDDFSGCFKKIIFAVPDGINYDVFDKVINQID